MSKINLRLPQFLKEVDELTSNMSSGELQMFIHEVARTWSEKERLLFIESLKKYSGKVRNQFETPGEEKIEDGQETVQKIQTIMEVLEAINHGDRLLDSEYNEEWDDWYNSDADEVIFYDPDGIVPEIDNAIKTVHCCVDREMYKEGCEIAEALSALEVYAKGDYNDYDGAPLSIGDLDEYDLLTSDYNEFAKDCLYLSYMGNRLDNRPEKLFCMMGNLEYPEVKLEDIMQMGNKDLPDFDEFLGMWIEYLGRQRGRFAERLLKEAQSLLKDDTILLENARKYVKEYPSLYKQILELKLNTAENGKMFLIGMEALESIPISYVVRSEIALLTAEYAMKMGKQKDAERCWVEAFRSDSTVMNYWRIRLLSGNWKEYRDEVQAIYESLYMEVRQREKRYQNDGCFEKANDIGLEEYCTLLVYDGQFEKMKEVGMSTSKSLGWSSTYMKQGLAFVLLKLYRGSSLPSGLKSMQMKVSSASNINAERFYFGTGGNRMKSDSELLSMILSVWKNETEISDADTQTWMKRIDKLISTRVAGIMDNNRRNYYGECASYIAAFGEVKESQGNRSAKALIMEDYKRQYSRRSAFHKELRAFGMK